MAESPQHHQPFAQNLGFGRFGARFRLHFCPCAPVDPTPHPIPLNLNREQSSTSGGAQPSTDRGTT